MGSANTRTRKSGLVGAGRSAWALGRGLVGEFLRHDGATLASSIAYHALLSVFPLVLLASALAAHLLDPGEAQRALARTLSTYLPPDAVKAVQRSVAEAVRARAPAGLVALALFLWWGSAATGSVRHALNRVLGVTRTLPFWRCRLLDMAATLLLGSLLGASLSLSAARAVLARLSPRLAPEIVRVLPGLDALGSLGPPVLTFATFALAYRLLPARRLPWRALLAGAAVAAALFEAARALSFRALESFARYQLVYGSLAGVIVFLVWVYVAAVVFLLGAEVASWAASSTEPRRGPDGS
jgi:membrane protein